MSSTDDRLIMMANQIAKFFESQPEELRKNGVRDHINKFWEKRMRTRLVALAKSDKANSLHTSVRHIINEIN